SLARAARGDDDDRFAVLRPENLAVPARRVRSFGRRDTCRGRRWRTKIRSFGTVRNKLPLPVGRQDFDREALLGSRKHCPFETVGLSRVCDCELPGVTG